MATDGWNNVPFTCPKCGGHGIEEVMAEVTVASLCIVTQAKDGTVDVRYKEQSNEGGFVDRYQCAGCGFTIIDEEELTGQSGEDGERLVEKLKRMNNSD